MASVFVDSTTLLYVMDERDPWKSQRAEAWLRRGLSSNILILNVQVLNEVYWVLRRKFRESVPLLDARRYVQSLEHWAKAGLSHRTRIEGWVIEDRYGLRFWDAMLIAAAEAAGCGYFLSEDLNDGQNYRGVQAVNPFRHAPEDVLGPALSR